MGGKPSASICLAYLYRQNMMENWQCQWYWHSEDAVGNSLLTSSNPRALIPKLKSIFLHFFYIKKTHQRYAVKCFSIKIFKLNIVSLNLGMFRRKKFVTLFLNPKLLTEVFYFIMIQCYMNRHLKHTCRYALGFKKYEV